MNTKTIFFALAGLCLLANCIGKSKQPKPESLWETPDQANAETVGEEEFVMPDLSRKEEINRDSLVVSVKVSANAQSTDFFKVIDSAQYVAVYDVALRYNTADPDFVLNDVHVLQIGGTVSKTFSRYVYEIDSMDTEGRKTTGTVYSAKYNYSFTDIYKNYPEGKLTVSSRSPSAGPILKYEEAIPYFNWHITEQTKHILSYTCRKATTSFRGRSYEAWFAEELPFNDGPWKFNGLPGLILEVYDTQKHYVFTCSSFNRRKTPEPVKFWQWDYKNTTREKADIFLRQAYNNPKAFFEVYMKEFLKLEVFANIKNTVYAYNPMELDGVNSD